MNKIDLHPTATGKHAEPLESLTEQSSMVVYRRLLRYAKPYALILLGAFLAMAVDAGSYATFARLMEPLLDQSFDQSQPGLGAWMPAAIIGLVLVRSLAAFAAQYGIAAVGRSVVRDLRAEVFAKYLQLPARFFDVQSSAQLMSRLTYNVEQVARACTNALTIIVRDSMVIVFLLAVMLYYSVQLTLGVLVFGPLIAFLISRVSRRFRRLSKGIQSSVGDVSEITEEVVMGHRIVRIYGGEEQEQEAFGKANNYNRRQNLKLVATQSANSGLIQLAAAFALGGIVYAAIRPEATSTFTPGAFMAFITAMLAILPSLRRLTNVHAVIQTGVAGADSVFQILDTEGEKDTGTRKLEEVAGGLEFKGVSLAYDDQQGDVLHDVSFCSNPGKLTALVGQSGSGKSSLANLIPRFYEPRSGQILLDGIDIREFPLRDLRGTIALVSQEVMLFNDSIANNISYGALRGVERSEIVEAARQANALDFIEALPEGLDTQVGERGILLSGGQRQRIAIARAILKDAPILILDEATSALDTESERAIQAALEQIMHTRTTLVIAHRLSTVENADQVIVLHEGRIAESGTHAELLSRKGRYAHLHELQFQATAEGES